MLGEPALANGAQIVMPPARPEEAHQDREEQDAADGHSPRRHGLIVSDR